MHYKDRKEPVIEVLIATFERKCENNVEKRFIFCYKPM